MGKHRVMIFTPLRGNWSRGRKCIALGCATDWWQSRIGHKSIFCLAFHIYTSGTYIPLLVWASPKYPINTASIAKCIVWDTETQEMSSQLSMMMEDLQNSSNAWQCVTLLWLCLCREKDGVFVNEVSLEVYGQIQSDPGKPSFAGI